MTPLKIAKQVDEVLRSYWGKPRSEEGAEKQIRNLAQFIRKAIKENWTSQEIVDYVKLATFTNCMAWSPKQIAEGRPHIYWGHQGQVAAIVKNGLTEMGKK
jgi:hypothetical protein